MDAGSFSPSSSSISSTNSMPRLPLREHIIPHRHTGPRKTIGDRFIPVRSAMDFDMAHYLLSQGRKEKENAEVASSPSKEAYKKQLAEALNMNRTRILAFKAKPPVLKNDEERLMGRLFETSNLKTFYP